MVENVETFIDERRLGPDPLADDVDLDEFRSRIAGRSTAIKAVLMDQSVLAGLGNVYTDEILFQAGLNPVARTDRLRDETITTLHRVMLDVLDKSIESGADPRSMPAGSCCRTESPVTSVQSADASSERRMSAAGAPTTARGTRAARRECARSRRASAG